MLKNATRTLTIKVKPTQAGTLTQTAVASSPTSDPHTDNNTLYSSVDVNGSSGSCSGCYCNYDIGNNEANNDQSPGVLILELHNKTNSAQKCISGVSDGSSFLSTDKDYYYFEAGTDGNVTINTSSPNQHDFHMQVWVGGSSVYGDTIAINHHATFSVSAGDRVILYFKETGFDLDKYEATITFTPKSVQTNFACANPKEFDIVFQTNAHSKMIMAGNTNLCKRLGNSGHTCDPSGAGRNESNNDIYMINNDYDDEANETDSGTTTHNSSAAYLDIPAGKEVLWAGLFWQGYLSGTNLTDVDKEKGRTVKFKHEGEAYETLSDGDIHWIYIQQRNGGDLRMYYQSFVEVTDYVNTHGGGYYWVGDIATSEGTPVGGSYGAWALAVVYKDRTEKFRNTTIFYGYKGLMQGDDVVKAREYAQAHGCPTDDASIGIAQSIESNVSGFLTPKYGSVDAKLMIFAGEGDTWASGEYGYVTDKSGAEHNLSNSLNPNGNIMNATITRNGRYVTDGKPYYSNNSLGVDIDIYDMNGSLDNYQTSTTIGLQTVGDGYYPGVYGFEAQLKEAQICFDYTYGQEGTFVTAPDISYPRIIGRFKRRKPLDVKLYFENNASEADVQILDLKVNIDPIDSNQSTYRPDSVSVKTPEGTLQDLNDTAFDAGPDHLRGIPEGNLTNNTNAYVYFSLDLNRSRIDMPLNASIDYNMTVDLGGNNIFTLNHVHTPLNKINPCTTTSHYQPKYGVFNVVHPRYRNTGERYYYNLPTQVVGRAGNFKLQTMDAQDFNRPVSLGKMTVAALEMIDVAGFHYTTATCTDPNATVVSTRLWAITDGNSSLTDLKREMLREKRFFSSAIANAAFRISYNVDQNGSLLTLTQTQTGSRPKYTIDNLPSDLNTTCQSKCQGDLSPAQLSDCMECIYNQHTRRLCSRDNFAIRPESYAIALYDMNQSDETQRQFIGDNLPGVGPVHLAAGYKYIIEINATDHNNTGPTPRYNASGIDAKFQWAGPAACDDKQDKNINVSFYNGHDDLNKSVSQAGIYTLSIVDSNWTNVDHRSDYMAHHVSGLFSQGADCALNSDAVLRENVWSALNGCEINSTHTNVENTRNYTNMNVSFHPYKFDLSSVTPHIRPNDNGSWVYMNDLNRSQVMAVSLEGNITAQGYDNVILSNYTDGCMANDLNLSIDFTSYPSPVVDTGGTPVPFEQIIQKADGTFAMPPQKADGNVTFTKDHFASTGDANGSADLTIYYNIKKPYSGAPVNVTDINISALRALGGNQDKSSVDFISGHLPDGNKTWNNNRVHFFFSRIAPTPGTDGQNIYSPKTTAETALLAQVYCQDDASINLNCYTITELQAEGAGDGWYRNVDHHSSLGDGNVSLLAPSVPLANLSISPSSNITIDTNGSSSGITISYPTTPRPVHPVIVITPDEWLKYNPDPGKNGLPEFQLNFLNAGFYWKGIGRTGHVVDTNNTSYAPNNRIGW